MIPIVIYRYFREGKELVKIRQRTECEKCIVDNLDEFNKRIESFYDLEDECYVSIFIKSKNINFKEIISIENMTIIYGVHVAKIKGSNIYVFVGKDDDLLEYIEKRCFELLEIKLNVNNFEIAIDEYKHLFERGSEKDLRILIRKNVFYLPLLNELNKRLDLIKQEIISQEKDISGVFNTIKRSIAEENISTLLSWINISSQYTSQDFSIKLVKGLRLLSAFMGMASLLVFIASLDRLLAVPRALGLSTFLHIPILIIFAVGVFYVLLRIQFWFIERPNKPLKIKK